jgi:hypothetical protein
VEAGFRWIKNPTAIRPGWREKLERIIALAMLTVVGLLVYAVMQRQVPLYIREHDQQGQTFIAYHTPAWGSNTAVPQGQLSQEKANKHSSG